MGRELGRCRNRRRKTLKCLLKLRCLVDSPWLQQSWLSTKEENTKNLYKNINTILNGKLNASLSSEYQKQKNNVFAV
jgi:hypothetical protein